MLRRTLWTAVGALCLLTLAAVPASASGGSGGGGATGGGGGGGGGVTTPAPCGNLTVVAGLSSTGQNQVSGSTEKTCDGLPVNIRFADTSSSADCTLSIPTFVGLSYFKYGVHPPSRYSSSIYEIGNACSGTTHAISATLYDRTTNAVLSTATTTWVAP